jgi:hypothetical protein
MGASVPGRMKEGAPGLGQNTESGKKPKQVNPNEISDVSMASTS